MREGLLARSYPVRAHSSRLERASHRGLRSTRRRVDERTNERWTRTHPRYSSPMSCIFLSFFGFFIPEFVKVSSRFNPPTCEFTTTIFPCNVDFSVPSVRLQIPTRVKIDWLRLLRKIYSLPAQSKCTSCKSFRNEEVSIAMAQISNHMSIVDSITEKKT